MIRGRKIAIFETAGKRIRIPLTRTPGREGSGVPRKGIITNTILAMNT
ncbi:MAG: hypothetical protein K5770_11365 [Lachnospiraceae bacterium]|nr:hypothetical protein [Lachnospiraceae bacterium]